MKQIIEQGKFYHIYNRGIDSCDLFREVANYEHFLRLYDKYISPIASTFAWVLMPNHFHLLVRINDMPFPNQTFEVSKDLEGLNNNLLSNKPLISQEDLKGLDHQEDILPQTFEVSKDLKGLKPQQQFGNLFNAYAKSYNKRYHRTGGLFERAFKRKEVNNTDYLKNILLYIHNNPVHHGFCDHPMDYPWSSYLSCISIKPTKLQRETVIGWFDNEANFKQTHNNKLDINDIESFLEI